jgi:beta-galactosidase
MEIQKVAEPNPDYFASADKVRNWFDEPEGPEEKEGYLSLNSTMGEIQATEEGAALLASMMRQMSDGAAGGMGKGVQMTGAMQKMIARQPLKKLLVQGGMELDGDMARQLNAALNRIPKAD